MNVMSQMKVPVKVAKAMPAKKGDRWEVSGSAEGTVPRHELVLILLAMTCMVPLSTWVSTFNGLAGTNAFSAGELHGRYVLPLAMGGLMALMAGERLPFSIPKKETIIGVGIGTVALAALDYFDMMRDNLNVEPYMVVAEPGIGMYLAMVFGVALILAMLVPKRRRFPFVTERPLLRPGSRGSGP